MTYRTTIPEAVSRDIACRSGDVWGDFMPFDDRSKGNSAATDQSLKEI